MLAPLVFAAVTAMASTGLATVRYNTPPPNFAIRGPRGTAYLSDLRGKVVVIDFWATWCDVCTAEMHDFVRAKREYGDRIAIVTVSNELHDVAASYFRVWNIDLPVVEGTERFDLSQLLGLEDSGYAGPRPSGRRGLRLARRPQLGGALARNRAGGRWLEH